MNCLSLRELMRIGVHASPQTLPNVLQAESLTGLEIMVTDSTLEAEEAVRDVLHHVESDSHVQALQSTSHGH